MNFGKIATSFAIIFLLCVCYFTRKMLSGSEVYGIYYTKSENPEGIPHKVTQKKASRPEAQTGHLCPQKSRIALYKSVCSDHGYHQPTRKVVLTALDFDRKSFGCLIPKAGSTSWTHFLTSSKTDNFTDRDRTNKTFLAELGLERRQGIPVAVIPDQFDGWVKYMVVRHPLQRVVSGYYEGVHTRNCCKKPDNSKLTFLEFMEGLVSGKLIDRFGAWQFYTERCRMCDVDYQFIVKQETLEQDAERFKRLLGMDKDKDLSVVVKRPHRQGAVNNTDNRYKYDQMWADFQEKHPDLMRGLLKLLQYDMEMFGYSWDWKQRRSYCSNAKAGGCC